MHLLILPSWIFWVKTWSLLDGQRRRYLLVTLLGGIAFEVP
jgi:hypothetical protein